MAGTPYQAGGIRSTVTATRAAPDEVLRANLARLTKEMLAQGTTTLECKSGYGLTVATRRARSPWRRRSPRGHLPGGHVVPPEYEGDRAGYLDLVCGPMLSACARTPAGSTCSANGGRSTRTRRRRSWPRGARPGCCPGCTRTSSGRVPACRSPWRRGRPPRTIGLLSERLRRGRPRGVRHRVFRHWLPGHWFRRRGHAAARVEFSTGSRTRRPAAAGRRGDVALATDCNPGPASPPACRCAWPWPSGRRG